MVLPTIIDTGKQDRSIMGETRTSSPFDHEASFIAIASSPEPGEIDEESSESETSPESCLSPTDQFTPHSPFFFLFPPLVCPITPFQSTSPIRPYVTTPTAVPGDTCLAKAMGYSTLGIDHKSAHLIRADALTEIEKLTLGIAMTKRPREMSTLLVRSVLEKLIPQTYFTTNQTKRQCHTEIGRTYSDDEVSRAAAKYIKALHQMRDTKEKARLGVSKALAIKQAKISERAVATALDRMETWCDEWLAGRMAEEDWNRWEDAL